jgi:CcmD family protein
MSLPRTAYRALALCLLLSAAPVLAEDAAADRAQSFRAVEGAVKEDVPGGPLLVGAYALVWLAVFGYLVRLVRQQARTEAEIARLEKALATRGRSERPHS